MRARVLLLLLARALAYPANQSPECAAWAARGDCATNPLEMWYAPHNTHNTHE